MLESNSKQMSQIHPVMGVDDYLTLGSKFECENAFDKSESCYRKAIELDEYCSEAYVGIARLLLKVHQYTSAIEHCKKAISIKQKNLEAYVTIGVCNQSIGCPREAISYYESAICIDPTKFEPYYNIAVSYESLGDLEKAILYYKNTLKINSDHSSSYRRLAELINGDELLRIFEAIDSRINYSLNDEGQIELCFAAASVYEKLGDIDKAFYFIEIGNKLKFRLNSNSDKIISNSFAGLKRSAKRLNGFKLRNISFHQTPIFIVGMPRSGTTLLEQILSNHSDVCGCGELPYVNLYGHQLFSGFEKPTENKIKEFSEKYMLELGCRSEGYLYAIDKSPGNFRAIGLILNALPNAKIIHIHRDPKAVCWSLYKNYFATNALEFSYSITTLVEFYRNYFNTIEQWTRLYDEKILHVCYDDLVIDPERVIKKILDYLGLDWEQSLLTHEFNPRSVATASSFQVRKPIYKGSNSEWLKWKPYLKGAFDQLDKYIFHDL